MFALCRRFSVCGSLSFCFRSLSTSPTDDGWLSALDSSALNSTSMKPFKRHGDMTGLVRAIADAKAQNLHIVGPPETPLKAFELPPNHSFPFEGCGPSVLFIRNFYESLFTKIRSLKRCVLIGNPRLGKSIFHFYYLSRIFNPDLFGPLPPNHVDSAKVEFVIRQVGANDVEIYDVATKEVLHSPNCLIRSLFDSKLFDPLTTVYLFEPDKYKGEPVRDGALQYQVLATVSPDESRYKEFCKIYGTRKLYFPCWSLEDLKSARRYLWDHNYLPNTKFFSEESIEDRYERFGGIFQHVFANSPRTVEALKVRRNELIRKSNLDAFLINGNIESPFVSHLIMQYTDIPLSGESSFETRKFEFVSEDVKKQVMERALKITLEEKIRILIRNDILEVSQKACREIYEDVVPRLLSLGTKGWGQRSDKSTEYISLALSFPGDTKIVECNQPPKINEMEDGVIYKLVKENYPAVDFQFRLNGRLFGVDVTRRVDQKKKEIGPVKKWLESVGVTNPDDVSLVIVPPPLSADRFRVIYENEVQDLSDLVSETLVWKLPPGYRL